MLKKSNIRTVYILVYLNVIIFTGCSHYTSSEWQPDTQLLDKLVRTDPKMDSFIHDVKMFYENLHNKNWAETYDQRSETFRSDVPKQLYLKLAQSDDATWELANYKVLSIETSDNHLVILVCKFVEGPIEHESYKAVTWRLEKDGKWHCDDAGPVRLSIFHSSRAPK
jgi:hypothetical protein